MIPDKVYVEATGENEKELNDFLISISDCYEGYHPGWKATSGSFFVYPQIKSNVWGYSRYDHDSFKDYTQVDLETFKKRITMDNFVLPENWSVKGQNKEEWLAINEYTRSLEGGEHWTDSNNFAKIHYLHVKGNRYYASTWEPIKECTEITFEQFKKHVLMKEKPTKEVLGYKVKPEFLDMINKLFDETFMDKDFIFEGEPIHFTVKSGFADRARKAKVLNIWFDPVYLPEVKTLEVEVKGLNKNLYLKIHSNGKLEESYDINNSSYINSELDRFIHYIKKILDIVENYKVGIHDLKIATVEIGCWKDVNFEELKKACTQVKEFLEEHNLWH